MAFSHGKDTKVFVSGYDLTAYLNTANTAMNADLAETSAFGSVYKSFVAGLVDSKMTLGGFFDPTTGATDATLTSLLGIDTYLNLLPQGDAFGLRGRGMHGVEISYEITTGLDGAAGITMEAQSKTGAEAIIVNTPKAAKGTTGNDAAGYDCGVTSTSNGWSAFLQAFAMSGSGTPTLAVKLQDSADNSAFLDVSGGGFVTLSAANANVPGGQRITGTGVLRRYTRFLWTIAGTTPSFTIFAAHVRK
jgi:hypothetical protein